MFKKMFSLSLGALLAVTLAACGDNQQAEVNLDPVAFHSGDECHVCGMIISEWPGPKGEIIEAKNGQVHKFCSTTDMFSWLLQPENANSQLAVYVHDMSQTAWDKPEDEHLVDARLAFYVLGSEKMGMGPTLASFASVEAAQVFSQQHGGEVLSFAQIDYNVMQKITRMGIEHMQDGSQHHHN